MNSIYLYSRGDRLGGHILQYLSIIMFAFYNNLYIVYDLEKLKYVHSVFVKGILAYIDEYNMRFDKSKIDVEKYKDLHIEQYILEFGTKVTTHDYFYTYDLCIIGQEVVRSIKSDLPSYFNKYLREKLVKEIPKFLPENYVLPFNKEKTIMVHLRLEDVRDRADYDGRHCSNYYRERINNDNEIIQGIRDLGYANRQTPLAREKVELAIEEAKNKYPEHEVVIVTAPGDYEIDYPYKCIRSEDESYDLYLLCNCDVLILSRSTFSLVGTLLGNPREVWCPLWGHFVCMGLDTKYDNSKFNYFY